MFKDILLQFIISLLPVFAFQIWYEKETGWFKKPIFMDIFCGITIVLCTLTAPNFLGFELDFSLIPYMLASLYGGVPTLALFTAIYFIVHLPFQHSVWEYISFIVFTVVFVTFVFIAIRPFQQAVTRGKERISMLLMGILMMYFIITTADSIPQMEALWSIQNLLTIVLILTISLASTWVSIFMVESVKEKQQLHEAVKKLSISYRSEVEKLQQFIDETSFAVIIVDCEGRITHSNEMAMKLLYLKSEISGPRKLIGKNYIEVFQPGNGDVYINLLSQALTGSRTSLVPFVNNDKMLLKTTFSLRSTPSNQTVGAALIVQDITELTKLRSEVDRIERLSLVGQMAASITHEIRNPMAVIRGFIQLIKERSPNTQEEYFKIVLDELDRANLIISDFLSLAQNRALTMELSSLNTIISGLLPLLTADANLRGQVIETDLCEDMPLIMLNDREIKQLFLNLARNGMEAMDDHGALHISTHRSQDRIELRIKDEGSGISPEKMESLFEPFFTTKARGTGLGLPLCLSIAERHNGKIDVESQLGEGTTFIVSFFFPQEEETLLQQQWPVSS